MNPGCDFDSQVKWKLLGLLKDLAVAEALWPHAAALAPSLSYM